MSSIKIKPEVELRKYYFASFWICFIGLLLIIIIPGVFAPFPVNATLFWCAAAVFIIGIPFLFWIPVYFRELDYEIEDDIVRGKKGVFFKKRVTVPFTKITNVDITQGPLERYYNIGSIHIQTAGAPSASGQAAELKLEGIRDLEKIKDEIMNRVKNFYLKQNVTPSAEGSPEKSTSGDDSTMTKILQELTAIRKGLENK